MLVIRFFRTGKTNQPSFKIVITDKRKPPRAGRFVEEVGFWNPVTKEKVLRQDRIKYWLSVGAKPSPTVYNLLISEKIIEGKKIPAHKKTKKKEEKPAEVLPKKEEPKTETAPAAETLKAEEPPKGKPKEEVIEEKPAPEKIAKEALKEEKPAEKTAETPKSEEKQKEVPKKE